jgi:hypothetical protein
VSHKLLRFFVPLLLMAMLAVSAVSWGDPLLRTLFGMQVAFYLVGALGGNIRFLQRHAVVRVVHYFTMVQWAMLVAWSKYAMGEQQVTWEPSKRPAVTHGTPR